MFKKLYFFYIKFVLLYTIVKEEEIKLFVKKSNEVIKTTINDMKLLEILPIEFKKVNLQNDRQVTKTICMFCFKKINELKLKRIYIFKYMYNITFENNVIIICRSCLVILNSLSNDETNTKDNSLDLNQQESSPKKKKPNISEINNYSTIYDLLSNKTVVSLIKIKYYYQLFKNKNYRIISLRKIFEINLILKTFEDYKNILNLDFLHVNDVENLSYFILNRFDIEQGYFDLKNEILIYKKLYYKVKTLNTIERINKMKTLQTNIDNGKLIIFFFNCVAKKHIWYNDIYLNLIILNEVSKYNDLVFNQFEIEKKYLNVFSYIYIFESFNDNIKETIQKKFSENWIKYDYKLIINQLFHDIEKYNIFYERKTHLYNKKQFENTIIKYYKSFEIKSKKERNKIIKIENNIVNF